MDKTTTGNITTVGRSGFTLENPPSSEVGLKVSVGGQPLFGSNELIKDTSISKLSLSKVSNENKEKWPLGHPKDRQRSHSFNGTSPIEAKVLSVDKQPSNNKEDEVFCENPLEEQEDKLIKTTNKKRQRNSLEIPLRNLK